MARRASRPHGGGEGAPPKRQRSRDAKRDEGERPEERCLEVAVSAGPPLMAAGVERHYYVHVGVDE